MEILLQIAILGENLKCNLIWFSISKKEIGTRKMKPQMTFSK